MHKQWTAARGVFATLVECRRADRLCLKVNLVVPDPLIILT